MRRLSDLPIEEARAALSASCGSTAWVERMLATRPFKDKEEVFAAADHIWWDLSREDWLEAFRAHPRIGEPGKAHEAAEQTGAQQAGADVKAALAAVNHEYEAKFGWIYIVCATGKSGHEMLGICRSRLGNPPDVELKIAAAEQLKITRLRLERLLTL